MRNEKPPLVPLHGVYRIQQLNGVINKIQATSWCPLGQLFQSQGQPFGDWLMTRVPDANSKVWSHQALERCLTITLLGAVVLAFECQQID